MTLWISAEHMMLQDKEGAVVSRTQSQQIAIYAVTHKGVELARTLAAWCPATLYMPERMLNSVEASSHIKGFSSLTACVAETFHTTDAHLFITATGIAVRAIAPHLRGKDIDPAVVVMDQAGRHVISLLSGHLGGANALAQRLAEYIGGTAVITTATDTEQLPSIDLLAQAAGCAIHSIQAIKHINGALLAGEQVLLDDPADILGIKQQAYVSHFTLAEDAPFADADMPSVVVSWRMGASLEMHERTLLLHPKVLCAGIGSKRGVDAATVLALLRTTCAAENIAVESIRALASVDAKADEQGIIDAAAELGVPLVTFPADQLDAIAVPNPSDKPKTAVGTKSVAEAAALCCTQQHGNGQLLVEKRKGNGVTLAVALEIE